MENPSERFENSVKAALRTKPFLLLAGLSGTGKSNLVRQLARGCCPEGHALCNEVKPGNFECIAVRPNWHDSTELLGYLSRVGGKAYQHTCFVDFLAKAWKYAAEKIPFFLCLDEMNLAHVEQYFAEYLSCIESRKKVGEVIETDVLVRLEDEEARKSFLKELFPDDKALQAKFDALCGISLPPNLLVMGTVNMDDTTKSFSRKVLDRAMTFELNEVDWEAGLRENPEFAFGSIDRASVLGSVCRVDEIYAECQSDCDRIVKLMRKLEGLLGQGGRPFRVAYRTRNEVMIYCYERTKNGTVSFEEALDEAIHMKILSRIEGETRRDSQKWLESLSKTICESLGDMSEKSVCVKKLGEIKERLESGYASYWQ